MIDIIFALFMLVAILKGYQKGLIIALFSIIAFVIGLAAALKLSAAVAVHLQHNITVSSKWLPIISFVLVFFIVAFLINLGGKLIEKTFEMAMLGWVNRLGGVFLYIMSYTIIFSVFLFYTDKIKVFDKSAIATSQTYPIVAPLGPKVINGFGKLIPLFKDTFSQLELFFETVSGKIQE